MGALSYLGGPCREFQAAVEHVPIQKEAIELNNLVYGAEYDLGEFKGIDQLGRPIHGNHIILVRGTSGEGAELRIIGRTVEPCRGNPRTLTEAEVRAIMTGKAKRLP